jgi:hypothetical protein
MSRLVGGRGSILLFGWVKPVFKLVVGSVQRQVFRTGSSKDGSLVHKPSVFNTALTHLLHSFSGYFNIVLSLLSRLFYPLYTVPINITMNLGYTTLLLKGARP